MVRQHLSAVQAIITGGNTDDAAWGAVMAMVEQRRKLVDSESRRLVEMQQMITVEQAMALLAQLTSIITRHVPDRETRAAIAGELRGLIRRSPPEP